MNSTPTKSEIAAAVAIDELLSAAVTRNTGIKFGFFSGVSQMDVAGVIAAHRPTPDVNTPTQPSADTLRAATSFIEQGLTREQPVTLTRHDIIPLALHFDREMSSRPVPVTTGEVAETIARDLLFLLNDCYARGILRPEERRVIERASEFIRGSSPSPSAPSVEALVMALNALARYWVNEAKGFHTSGKEMTQEGNLAGKEYMQTAAALRACAKEMKAAIALHAGNAKEGI